MKSPLRANRPGALGALGSEAESEQRREQRDRFDIPPRPRSPELLKLNKYLFKAVPVQASRGCPYRCSFCEIPVFYSGSYRTRPVEEIVEELRADLEERAPVLLGAMIETPAAALMAGHIAREVDFLSIGSNDLTQYTLAMDRGHPQLAARMDALHPAVLQLVAATAAAGAGATPRARRAADGQVSRIA